MEEITRKEVLESYEREIFINILEDRDSPYDFLILKSVSLIGAYIIKLLLDIRDKI